MRNWLLTGLLPVLTVLTWSAAGPATAGEAAPGTPTAVQVISGDQRATVSWVIAADTDYTVIASPGGSSCRTAASSCTVPDLINGIGYSFSVVASTSAGTSSASAPSVVVRPAAPPAVAPLAIQSADEPSIFSRLFSWSSSDLGWLAAFGGISFSACALTLLLAAARRLGSDVDEAEVSVFDLGFEDPTPPVHRPTPRAPAQAAILVHRSTPAIKRAQPVRAPVRRAQPAASRTATRTPQRASRRLVP